MVRRLILAALAVSVGLGVAVVILRRPAVVAPAAGVPETLAVERAARVSDLRYAVRLRVPARRDQPVSGHVTASFLLADDDRALAFDFSQPVSHLTSVEVNAASIDPAIENGHIVIPAGRLNAGRNTVDFEFVAGDDALNRRDEFMYSLFVPSRASTAMPVFDQPNLKARWQLALDLPIGWTAVSNGRQSGVVGTETYVSVVFDETHPLPPYLFGFAAGKFTIESGERNGRTMRIFHRETDASRIARNRDVILDQHARAIAWMEAYSGEPYPFGKFDVILLPSFQFSGMEHPGAIFYNANTLLLDASATQQQRLAQANTIAHETAHMWFGDFVTMTWFNDVWMKEVFASFMAAKIVNPSFPEMNHDLRFLVQNYPAAYDVDRTSGSNPIRQPLDNLDDAGSLYGAIIYQKAPIAMRQLERLIGEDAFRDALREYIAAHRYGNADWPDLVRRFDERTPLDLVRWSQSWVEQPGRPSVETELELADGRIAKLSLSQSDQRGRGLLWPQRATVAVAVKNAVHTFDVTLDNAETRVSGAEGLPAPMWILPVAQGVGYGFFELDPATLAFLTTSLADIEDPLTRGAAVVALWESMVEGRVAPALVWDALIAALPRERDELNLQLMLDDARTLFWRYTAADRRAVLAPAFEALMRGALQRATTMSARAAWFGAIRGVATTESTLTWLEAVWRRDIVITGLPLAEVDETDLALDLAVRDRPTSVAILDAQEGRIQNPDRRARFAFIRPAVSGDAAERRRFFERLRTREGRRQEAWVVDAAKYLHHPLRAHDSALLVRPALDLLLEIKQTGDIFFPKRWADATLGGHQSVEVAAAVRDFIDGLPSDYPDRLRWVLLSSADQLFRAARVVNR